MRRCSALLAAVLVASACSPPTGARTEEPLHLELTGRYGSLDGALSLRAIRDLALTHGRGDTVLVLQERVPAVLLIGSEGDSLEMLGGAGSGPGEFRSPVSLTVLADTFWVRDVTGRLQRFDATARHVDQLTPTVPPFGPFQHAPRFRAALADGSLLMEGVSNPVGTEARAAVQAVALARVDRQWDVQDTVALLTLRESSYVLRFSDGTGVVGSHPAANPDVAAVDPEGRWIVVAAQVMEDSNRFGFELHWIGAEGDTLASRFIATQPVTSDHIRTEWTEDLVQTEQKPRGMVETAVADVPFPTYRAPALSIFVEAAGRAWVQSPHPSPDSAIWHATDADGPSQLAVLDREVKLLAARDDIVWGWTRGLFDEPYVLKFRAGS